MVSVIVPVYNVATTLRRCVDNILRQSYRDFELLLIDDGSTDSSPLLCDAYAHQDSRVRVFHKPNGGVSSARNVGLDHARGEWITFSYAMERIFQAYWKLMIQDKQFEFLLFSDYKKLCQMDIYKRPRVWYDAPGVRMVYDRTKHRFPLQYRVNYFLMSFSWVSRMRVKLKSMEE